MALLVNWAYKEQPESANVKVLSPQNVFFKDFIDAKDCSDKSFYNNDNAG